MERQRTPWWASINPESVPNVRFGGPLRVRLEGGPRPGSPGDETPLMQHGREIIVLLPTDPDECLDLAQALRERAERLWLERADLAVRSSVTQLRARQ